MVLPTLEKKFIILTFQPFVMKFSSNMLRMKILSKAISKVNSIAELFKW